VPDLKILNLLTISSPINFQLNLNTKTEHVNSLNVTLGVDYTFSRVTPMEDNAVERTGKISLHTIQDINSVERTGKVLTRASN